MKKFREFIKGIIAEEKKYSWETEGYTKIDYPKELKEQYKKLQNLKGEEQDTAIAALSDELKASLIEYGNEVSTHYGDYFFRFYEMADDYRWYSSERAEYIGDQNRFNRLLEKLNGGIVKEDIEQKAEIQTLPRSGNILWGWMLQPNKNNFIYHSLRNLNNEHKWNNIDKMLVLKIKEAPSKLSSLIKSKISVTLAVPLVLGNSKTIVLYPNAIIDSVESNAVVFHIDPKQYRTIKDKFGFNVQTTSLSLQWIKKNPGHKTIEDIELAKDTTGFKLQNGDKYWYKVYGKEKGQIHQFAANSQCVMLWEDLQEVFDTAIDWYDILLDNRTKKEAETNKYNNTLITLGEQLFNKDEAAEKLYNQAYKLKGDERIKFLQELDIEDLKKVEALAYYNYAYHYDIYADDHKRAEYAEDWHYHAEKDHLESIRDRDYSTFCAAKEVRKGKQ